MFTLARMIPALLAGMILTTASWAHVHLTVDTQGGRIVIRAGYYGNEADYAIDADGRFTFRGDWAVPHVADLFIDGPTAGWYGSADLVLTSDYFVSTGRLVGGHFLYEIVSVTPRRGGPGEMVWGSFLDESPDFTPMAWSGGADRLTRSFDVQVGYHDHGQACAFSAPGLYDVTLVAWDRHGRYQDSSPVRVRFRVGDVSPCVREDLDCNGSVDAGDIATLLLMFGMHGGEGDLDGNALVDAGDISVLLLSFGT
ncbi:MAG: hypothetical protein RLZZ558_301 [Planctomycetota bacterium]|jgi:hypothetical protein